MNTSILHENKPKQIINFVRRKTSSNTELTPTSSTLFQFNRSVQTSKLITDEKEDNCTVPKDDTIKDETGYSACVSFIVA